ncbi:MAG: GH3 auxin-responsive promoter family protein [Planctomycetota bacterium]
MKAFLKNQERFFVEQVPAMSRLPFAYRVRAFAGGPLRRRMRAARERFLKVASEDCRGAQRDILKSLLELNAGSKFSRDHGLSPRMTLAEFRSRLPVSDYERMRPYIDRVSAGQHEALLGSSNRLLMFAVTSGTTADSKLIPVTSRFLHDYRQGWQMWGIGTYTQHPQLQPLNIIQVSSSHRKFTAADGTPCGNISGLVATMQNPIVRTLYTIPAAVAEIRDADSRRRIIVRLALNDPHPGMLITANPGTLVQLWDYAERHAAELIEEIQQGGTGRAVLSPEVAMTLKKQLRPNPIRAEELRRILREDGRLSSTRCWPRLGTLGVWCGGSAGAYIPRLREIFGTIPIRDHGLHASEGRMTLPLSDDFSAGVLEVQTHFFEFLPVEEEHSATPIVLESHELDDGKDYFILLTTSSGLYRYNIRDVVRCVGFHGTTPLLEFRHKGSHISSITGEKITESQVVEAVGAASARLGVRPLLFTMTPVWGDPPGYTLYLASDSRTSANCMDSFQLTNYASAVDVELKSRNVEYAEKRDSGRLGPLRCEVRGEQQWAQFARTRQSRSGGSIEQYKHPCLVPDPQFQKVFLNACQTPGENTPAD